jgi:outer membrane protein assembly factor BamB
MEPPQYRLLTPFLAPYGAAVDVKRWRDGKLDLASAESPLAEVTLGDLGIAAEISGAKTEAAFEEAIPPSTLGLPFSDEEMAGIDAATVRMFRVDEDSGRLKPVWHSGVNDEMGFAWSRVHRPGRYMPIGLPRDRLLQQILREMARARRLAGDDLAHEAWQAAHRAWAVLTEPPIDVVEELREFLARVEVQTGRGLPQLKPHEIRFRQGYHIAPFPLPKDRSLEEFRIYLNQIAEANKGFAIRFPEEELFYPPDPLPDVPWHRPGVQRPGDDIDWREAEQLRIWEYVDLSQVLPFLFPMDWWMYQHDLRHTGAASGLSGIRSTTVNRMELNAIAPVDGPVITKPVIVDGKVYVGSGKEILGKGGTLFKIDLATGYVEGQFQTSGNAQFKGVRGIGGSPAVVGGRVYFTGVHGKVYCLDAATMNNQRIPPPALWITDLKSPSRFQNQPIRQSAGDSWSSPLVVNGKVYVGCGQGEHKDTYGFIFCLDAETGRVLWLFCTSKFCNRTRSGLENRPNVIPASVAVSAPLPQWAKDAGFTLHNDSNAANRETGCSVWSSCAYDRVLNRIYVGTGNSQYRNAKNHEVKGTTLPDEWYGSGLISLDADTGEFCAFFQPGQDDSYRPTEGDLDVSGSPTIFFRNGQRVLAFGSKNGSFFLLDPDTLKVLDNEMRRRQLLPRKDGNGLPGSRGNAIPTVAYSKEPEYENEWGVYATPAVHAGTGKLFVGLGGRGTITDQDKTPFVRALDWITLEDAWPTIVGPDKVSRYTAASPPLYTSSEVGLSSPAVVHDVLFVSTNRAALYAMDVHDGHCLWEAPGLPAKKRALGPAVYGDYVVIGAGEHVYIYVLGPRWAQTQAESFVTVPPASSPCERPPWEGPDLRRLEREKWKSRSEEPASKPKGLFGARELLLKMLSRLRP